MDELDLLDWKRRVFDIYARWRAEPDAHTAWDAWRAARNELFGNHPQSPIPPERRAAFSGLSYFAHDPALRVVAEVDSADGSPLSLPGSAGATFPARRFGTAQFSLAGKAYELPLYWIDVYGGGVFVCFKDATSGTETYGGGRYLLDTVKGADLGGSEASLVLDFNLAYNPSCVYDPRWACPLAPPEAKLPVRIEAGERAPGGA